MKYEQIAQIIKREVIRKGYEIKKHDSVSTDSHYFKIYSGNSELLFRISDHSTRSNVITFRIDGKVTEDSIKKFINNRIADLNKRSLKRFFY